MSGFLVQFYQGHEGRCCVWTLKYWRVSFQPTAFSLMKSELLSSVRLKLRSPTPPRSFQMMTSRCLQTKSKLTPLMPLAMSQLGSLGADSSTLCTPPSFRSMPSRFVDARLKTVKCTFSTTVCAIFSATKCDFKIHVIITFDLLIIKKLFAIH